MEKPTLSDDIAFARAMAEEGATAPSLSGRFAIMWSVLAATAFTAHWAIMRQIVPIEQQNIGFVWLSVMILGALGTLFLCTTLRDKPGQSTAGNRAEAAGWPIVTIAIFGTTIAIYVAVSLRGKPPILFDMIIPMAFAFYAVMTALSAKLFGTPSARWLVVLSLALSVLTTALVGLPEVYLIAAAGILATQLVPGLVALKAEPKAVV